MSRISKISSNISSASSSNSRAEFEHLFDQRFAPFMADEANRRLTALKEEIEKQIRRIELYENTEMMEIHKFDK